MKHVFNKIFTTGKMRYSFTLKSSLADLGHCAVEHSQYVHSHACVASFIDDDCFACLINIVVHAKVSSHTVQQHTMVRGHLRELLVLVTKSNTKGKRWKYVSPSNQTPKITYFCRLELCHRIKNIELPDVFLSLAVSPSESITQNLRQFRAWNNLECQATRIFVQGENKLLHKERSDNHPRTSL